MDQQQLVQPPHSSTSEYYSISNHEMEQQNTSENNNDTTQDQQDHVETTLRSNSVVSEHSYLGEMNPCTISNAYPLLEGYVYEMKIVSIFDMVVYPGNTIPIRNLPLLNFQDVKYVACIRRHEEVGTIVRITRTNDEHSVVVGKGYKRCKVLRFHGQLQHNGEVMILEDFHALDRPLSSFNSWYCYSWTAKLFDGKSLVYQCQQLLLNSHPSFSKWKLLKQDKKIKNKKLNDYDEWEKMLYQCPDPTYFSYWLCSHLSFDNDKRQELLIIDCTIRRLRRIIKFIESSKPIYYCKLCGLSIAHARDEFPILKMGFIGAFVNPSGYVHQMMTLYSIFEGSLFIDPSPSTTQDSWFHEYGWRIVYCRYCQHHLGWQFEASKDTQIPLIFWGLRCSELTCATQDTLTHDRILHLRIQDEDFHEEENELEEEEEDHINI